MIDILTNADPSICPKHCFTPVGLFVDGQARIFMSSDTTGEVWVVVNNTQGALWNAMEAAAGHQVDLRMGLMAMTVLGMIWGLLGS
jgi:hypothetical protein